MVKLIIKWALKKTVQLRISKGVYEVLNDRVFQILKNAEIRAKLNQRSTILPQDL